MVSILVTGFAPFAGRTVNASWITATAIAKTGLARALELPVEWGAPQRILDAYCRDHYPQVIVGLGEGKDTGVNIETCARNSRADRADNENVRPKPGPVNPSGPQTINASFDVSRLRDSLSIGRYPVTLSSDAGQFLCEETFYTLEMLRHTHRDLRHVMFIHLPPFGTSLPAERVICDEDFCRSFGQHLVHTVVEMAAQ